MSYIEHVTEFWNEILHMNRVDARVSQGNFSKLILKDKPNRFVSFSLLIERDENKWFVLVFLCWQKYFRLFFYEEICRIDQTISIISDDQIEEKKMRRKTHWRWNGGQREREKKLYIRFYYLFITLKCLHPHKFGLKCWIKIVWLKIWANDIKCVMSFIEHVKELWNEILHMNSRMGPQARVSQRQLWQIDIKRPAKWNCPPEL